MSKPGGDEDDEDERFYESYDRLLSSASCSCSNSDEDENSNSNNHSNNSPSSSSATANYGFTLNNYDIWISQPSSVSERRNRLLHHMGLAGDLSFSRANLDNAAMFRSKSDTAVDRDNSHNNNNNNDKNNGGLCSCSRSASSPAIGVDGVTPCRFCSYSSSCSIVSVREAGSDVNNRNQSGNGDGGPPNKALFGRNLKRVDEIVDSGGEVVVEERDGVGVVGDESACTIRDLDNGKEFVVKEVREDGMWGKLKEVGTGRQLTMEEFEMTVGHSPIVQELMRRQHVEEGHNKDNVDVSVNGGIGGTGSKMKKKGSWLKSIRSVASSMAGNKERRSSDERDTSSEKGGRRSSSATDDSQDGVFHGPERVRVRQYGKSCKEFTALYKSQEIQAHNGSIWSIKFSLDGKYLASAGEDCVIHVWQVVESERKGELLMEKHEDGNVNMLFVVNGSPERNLLSPLIDNHLEKKRKGRSSISRKSLSLDQLVVPETIFALTEKPICSFQGHLDDVLDLSWSKSQVRY